MKGTIMADPPKFPDQEELEKELSDYLSKKYGYRIKVVSPMMIPHAKDSGGAGTKDPQGLEKIAFDMKPEELEAYLNQYVIGQDDAKAILATKICTHYNRIRLQRERPRSVGAQMVGRIKNNILLIGPTGVGKTYLVKLIAKKLGVPFVKGDATKFSETGYVGGDVEDLVRELVIEAGEDIELAEHGIIYIDEVDKIASSQQFLGPDVSRTGVQRALLKPMEETEVDLKVAHDPISQIQAIEQYRKSGKRERRTVNTRNILFIMSGAFNGLAEIVKKRIQKQGIGFGAEIRGKGDEAQFLAHVKAEDLIEYGFESEFVGRLPVVAVLDMLDEDDLYQILKNPNNPIILGKKEDFRSYGIDLRFDDESLRLLAGNAYREKTGARGLVSVIEKALLPFEKSLPTSDVQYLIVSREVILDPMSSLRRKLDHRDNPDDREAYEKVLEEEKERLLAGLRGGKGRYFEEYPQVFSKERIDLLARFHLRSGVPLESIMEDLILLHDEIKMFETDFFARYGLEIKFDEEALNEILGQALEFNTSATAVCKEIARDFDYGLKLVSERTGQMKFILPKRAVLQHDVFLDELIRESYGQYPLNSSGSRKEPQ